MMDESTNKTIFTIGHSTRPFNEFVNLLKLNEIEILVDVRSLPGATRYPQYNQEELVGNLADESIEYIYMKILGGLRKGMKDSKNTAWKNNSFRAYADYMETDAYQQGLEELMKIAIKKRVAIMCAEAVWWRCHRSMISDSLKARGWEVLHIIDEKTPKEHPYTSPARVVDNKVTYHKNNE